MRNVNCHATDQQRNITVSGQHINCSPANLRLTVHMVFLSVALTLPEQALDPLSSPYPGLDLVQAVYGQRDIVGGLIYAHVHPRWRVGFEGEARSLRFHTSEDVTETNYIGGLRVLILRARRVDLYGKFLTGMGRITLPFDQAHAAFLAFVPGAGVDVALNHTVSVRVIDFVYQHWPQFPFGSFSPHGFSSGIRFRVTPRAFVPQSVRKRATHQKGVDAGDQQP